MNQKYDDAAKLLHAAQFFRELKLIKEQNNGDQQNYDWYMSRVHDLNLPSDQIEQLSAKSKQELDDYIKQAVQHDTACVEYGPQAQHKPQQKAMIAMCMFFVYSPVSHTILVGKANSGKS